MCRDDNATRNALCSCAHCVTTQPPDFFPLRWNRFATFCLLLAIHGISKKKLFSWKCSRWMCVYSCCTSISMHQTIIFAFAFASTCTNEMPSFHTEEYNCLCYSVSLEINLWFFRYAGKICWIKLTDIGCLNPVCQQCWLNTAWNIEYW